jgi:hypothetical protein
MTPFRRIAFATALAVGASLPLAATAQDRAAPRPASAASASVDARMQALRQWQDQMTRDMPAWQQKMKNAKTREERNAVLAEHAKAMEEGLAMMRSLSADAGRGDVDVAKRYQLMEERMEIMQVLMQMMLERPSAPEPAGK